MDQGAKTERMDDELDEILDEIDRIDYRAAASYALGKEAKSDEEAARNEEMARRAAGVSRRIRAMSPLFALSDAEAEKILVDIFPEEF